MCKNTIRRRPSKSIVSLHKLTTSLARWQGHGYNAGKFGIIIISLFIYSFLNPAITKSVISIILIEQERLSNCRCDVCYCHARCFSNDLKLCLIMIYRWVQQCNSAITIKHKIPHAVNINSKLNLLDSNDLKQGFLLYEERF